MRRELSLSSGSHDRSFVTRRAMLSRASLGFGALALHAMMMDESARGETQAPLGRLKPLEGHQRISEQVPHHVGKARSVILLFMGGGPSHVDTFDPKPELTRRHGELPPDSILRAFQRTATMGNGTLRLMASPFRFRQYGACGQPVSEILPGIAQHVDDLCIIRSMQHDTVIHMPGEYIMTTGTILGDRPSIGAWVTYGLGSENHDLPSYVVLGNPTQPTISNAFLPARFQGTRVSLEGVPHLRLPAGTTSQERRRQLDVMKSLNEIHRQSLDPMNSEWEARIAAYELAFRMQTAAPEAFRWRDESAIVQRLYGLDDKESAEVGTQCLLARRLVERGVRFVQVYVGGWDAHDKLQENHLQCARRSDRPIAGLLSDLKQRGLLDSTLVVWGGEFGRTPGAEKGTGRDHSPGGFTVWLAGGGVRGGQAIGATDAVGYTAIERPIHPNSLHATILHALGLDQDRVTFPHHGRTEIPTFLHAPMVHEVFSA